MALRERLNDTVLAKAPAFAEHNASTPGAGVQCKPGSVMCVETYVVDSQVFWSLASSATLGAVCIIAFCFLQEYIGVYRGRLVAVKPPYWRRRGCARFVYWMVPTLALSEAELLATAGLDALMFQRLIVLALQFFAPVAVLSCAVLIPLHLHANYLGTAAPAGGVQLASLMGLTMSNMPTASPYLWVHFTFVWLYVLYGMWLLRGHYKWYVVLRQHYMSVGDSLTPWFGGDSALGDGGDGKLPAPSATAATAAAMRPPAAGAAMEMVRQEQQQQEQPAAAGRPPPPPGANGGCISSHALAGAAALPTTAATAVVSPPESRRVSRQSSTAALLPGDADGSDGSSPRIAAAAAAGAAAAAARTNTIARRAASHSALGALGADAESGAAGSAAASGALGGDAAWWDFKTNDPLLDRHVAHVDTHADLRWTAEPGTAAAAADAAAGAAGEAPERLHYWWELAADGAVGDGNEALLRGLQAEVAARRARAGGAGQSHKWAQYGDLHRLPGNSRLLFDARSLRARKPSVRFRNTDVAPGADGRLRPLHVASYAVLVRDVPRVSAWLEGGGGGGLAGGAGTTREGTCEWLATSCIWHMPCLLSYNDVDTLLAGWRGERVVRELLGDLPQGAVSDGAARCGGGGGGGRMPGCFGRSSGSGGESAASARRRPSTRASSKDVETGRGGGGDAGATVAADAVHDDEDQNNNTGDAGEEADDYDDDGGARLALVEATFRSLFPDDLHAVVPVRNFQALDEKLRAWNFELQAYTQALALRALRGERGARRAEQRAARRAKSSGGGDVNGDASGGGASSASVEVGAASLPPLVAHASDDGKGNDSDDDDDGGDNNKSMFARLFGRGGGGGDARSSDAKADAALARRRQALVNLEASILDARRAARTGPTGGSFIVLFKTPQAASLAARSSVFPTNSAAQFSVQPAPGPEEVLWQSLWKSPGKRRAAALRTLPCYAFLFLFPTGLFTAGVNQITSSICTSPATAANAAWFCNTAFLQFLITVVLPFVLLMLWQNAVIPGQLYRLELRRAGAVSSSQMERNMLAIYFSWELTNLFLGGVLSASLVSQLRVLVENPELWAQILGVAFPQSSNYFLNYVIARAFMMNLFRLIMPHGGMWRWIGQMLFTACTSAGHAASERYRAFIIYPASIRYGREPGLVLLIFLIGAAYAVVAPLITPFVLAYMATSYLVWRYQILYVCVRAYESGGRCWPLYFRIVNVILALFVVFTSCIFLLKKANVQGSLVLLLLPILYVFNRDCIVTFGARVDALPLWLAHQAPRAAIDPETYVAPALRRGAAGWFFESGKAWVRWGSPPYV